MNADTLCHTSVLYKGLKKEIKYLVHLALGGRNAGLVVEAVAQREDGLEGQVQQVDNILCQGEDGSRDEEHTPPS